VGGGSLFGLRGGYFVRSQGGGLQKEREVGGGYDKKRMAFNKGGQQKKEKKKKRNCSKPKKNTG